VPYSYSVLPAGSDPRRNLSAEQRGNVTAAHRQVLAELAAGPRSTWSQQALWACLDRLRTGTWTMTPEVRVERAWTDGPEAFCVVYTLHGPDLWIGIRLRRGDSDSEENEPGSDVDNHDLGFLDPDWFGQDVADFSIGEPLGTVLQTLRTDEQGVNWWGSLDAQLPTTPA
jgi:hypothetical protein